MLLVSAVALAQADDPVIMVINGQPVTRSEFEYSYNKNNSEGVIEKKSVEEYVDLFINYKLKVAAALDAHYDTLSSFRREFLQYRDQQIRPSFIDDSDVEKEARNIYDRTQHYVDSLGGLVNVSHILIRTDQKATTQEQNAARQKADSIYRACVVVPTSPSWRASTPPTPVRLSVAATSVGFSRARPCLSLRRQPGRCRRVS